MTINSQSSGWVNKARPLYSTHGPTFRVSLSHSLGLRCLTLGIISALGFHASLPAHREVFVFFFFWEYGQALAFLLLVSLL